MRKLLSSKLILFVGLLFLAPLFGAFAQTTEEVSDLGSSRFDVALSEDTQSPITGAVPVTFTVTTKFSSNSVFIKWKASEKINFLNKTEVFTSLKKGQQYTFTQVVQPTQSGKYRITAVVEAVEAEATFIASDQINLTFDEALVRIPKSEDYQTYQLLWLIGRIAIVALILGAIILSIILGRRKFKEWLTKD